MLRAQGGVGINNPAPHASALLDLTSTDKGLLVPRMTTSQRDGIPLPATSLLVYNTTTARFEYFDGGAWVPLVNPGWSLTGNAGTNPATHFVGTTDAQPLALHTNSVERVRITETGNVGVGTSVPARRLHVATGSSGATSNANAAVVVEGAANTYQHFLTPSAAESGFIYGTELGSIRGGLFFNNTAATDGMQFRTGGNNTRMTLTGTGDLGIGTNTPARRLHVFTGSSGGTSNPGTAVVVEGAGNTYQHFLTPSTSESGFIFGTNAASIRGGLFFNNAATSDGMQFRTGGNNTRMTLTGTGALGIGTNTPQERLHVVGNMRMVDGNQAANKVLTSDANGTGSWQVPKQPDHYVAVGTTDFTIGGIFTLPQMTVTFVPKHPLAIVHFSASSPAGSVTCETPLEFQIVVNGSVVQSVRSGTVPYTINAISTSNRGYDVSFTYPVPVPQGVSTNIQIRARSVNCGVPNNALSAGGPGGAFRSLVVIDPNGTGLTTTTGVPPSSGAWDLIGNATTNPSVNFLGTTDNQSLAFRTFNTERMRIGNTGNVGIGTAAPLDRLHVVGNLRLEDGSQAAGRVLVSDLNGRATWTDPGATASGTLDQAYDFGGPGAGSTIVADAGAVTIAGTDGLVSTGTQNAGALMPAGPGLRMVWNPRKGAFRAGAAVNTEWDDANTGLRSVAFGAGTTASGGQAVAWGFSTQATGVNSTAWGLGSIASGAHAAAWGNNSVASGNSATAIGEANTASGANSLAMGTVTTASGSGSFSQGNRVQALSAYEVVLGQHNTVYTPASATVWNAADRLFTLGNGTSSAALSDAMVVLKSGNTGIGTSTPARRLHVATGISGATSNNNAVVVVESGAAAYQHFMAPSTAESGVLFGTEVGSIRSGIIFNNTNVGEGLIFRTGGNTNRMSITNTGDVGIGTITPQAKLHVSGPAGYVATRIGNTSATGSTSNVGLEFFRNGAGNTDWQIYNIGPNLTMGNSGDDLATVNDLFQFQGTRFIPMTDATLSLGQNTFRWNTVFASNGTINTSDARQKTHIREIGYGLDEVMRLRPVSFRWKQDDGSGTKLGLIAQELQEVVPEVVRDWDWEVDEQGQRRKVDAEVLGVYYSDLIPVLIKAVQEQQAQIDALRNELQQLRDQR